MKYEDWSETMANSIIFQNNPEQLKAGMYGYNAQTKTYEALKITDKGLAVSGTLAVGDINKISEVGTLNKVTAIGTVGVLGTLKKIGELGTVDKVAEVGTVAKVGQLGTVGVIGTLKKVGELGTVGVIGTLKKVAELGTLSKVADVGTIAKVGQLGTVGVIGTLKKVGELGTVGVIGTLKKVSELGTVDAVLGTVNVNVAGRGFYSRTVTVTLPAAGAGATVSKSSSLFDVSNFADTTYYIRNITTNNVAPSVSIHMEATPSNSIVDFPLVDINQVGALNAGNPTLLIAEYYLKYNSVRLVNSTQNAQTIQIILNARY